MKNIYAFVSLLILWQICFIVANEPLVFPSLYSLLVAFIDIIQTQFFWKTYFNTIITLFVGWSLCLILSTICVFIALKVKPFRILLEKYCSYFSPLPSFAVIPFFILFFGFGKGTVLGIMVISVFWNMAYQILATTDTITNMWQKHVKNLNWNLYKSFTYVYLPAAAPTLIKISNMTWTHMWRILITLEIAFGTIGGYFGLGTYIMDVKTKLDIDKMYVIFFVIAVTGVSINSIFEIIARRLSKHAYN